MMTRQKTGMRKGIALGLCLLFALTISAGEFPLQLADQFGRELTLNQAPEADRLRLAGKYGNPFCFGA